MGNYLRLKNQSGVSLIAAIFIIVILAFMGMVFLTLFTVTSSTSINELQSTQALYVAEGGIERSIRYFTSPTLTEREACASISAANTSLGSGQFSLTIEAGSPFYSSAATTVTDNPLTSGATTINVGSTAGYASYGRIMIDRELIDYTGTTANSFTGALRGRDGTTAVSHANGTRVGQDQCTVSSTGGIYNLTTPNARRQVREGIQLQEGWAVGDTGVILRWDGVSWSLFTTTGTWLRGVSMDSYANGWTVGDIVGGEAQIRRWTPDGTPAWDLNNYPNISNDDRLNAVHTLSHNEAWAVGNDRGGGGNDAMIMHWDGTNWVYEDPAGNVNSNLNSVYMLDTDNDGIANAGWAVGDRYDGCAGGGPARLHTILQLTGANWTRLGTPQIPACSGNNRDLNGVFAVSVDEAWAVGDRRGCTDPGLTILRWNGASSSWACSAGLPVVDENLFGIFMLDTDSDGLANDGWAVGNTTGGRPTMLRWNYNCAGTAQNNQWNNCTASAPNTGQRLNSVFMITATDGWAVGNGGTILHWDGSSWSVHPQSGVVTAQNLFSISIIGPKQRPQAMWREVFQ